MPALPVRYARAYGPDNPPPPWRFAVPVPADESRRGMDQGITRTVTVVDGIIREHVERVIEIAEKSLEKHSDAGS